MRASQYVGNRIRALVYSDLGADSFSVSQSLQSIQQMTKLSVTKVDAREICQGALDESVALLAIPGGLARFYSQQLGVIGENNIKRYVANGGRCLGICAGAYYMFNSIDFAVGGEYEIRDKPGLGFFKQKMIGPFYGGYNPKDYHSAIPMVMNTPNGSISSLVLWGGVAVGDIADIKVLASYRMRNYPAITVASYGNGMVAASSPHIEFSAQAVRDVWLGTNDPYWVEHVIPLLDQNEEGRVRLFTDTLRAIGLSEQQLSVSASIAASKASCVAMELSNLCLSNNSVN